MTRRPHPRFGFTLLELMVVVTILAGVLLLVPPNLYKWGARSRLDNAANTLVSTVGAAREQAIIDGHAVKIELGVYKTESGKVRHGHRLVMTNIPADRSDLLNEGLDIEEEERPKEREWVTTDWTRLGDGIEFSGISERADHWVKPRQDQTFLLSFGPDGSVEKGFAIRLASADLEEDTKTEDRTITVLINALTAEAQAIDGFQDIPEAREENEFQK